MHNFVQLKLLSEMTWQKAGDFCPGSDDGEVQAIDGGSVGLTVAREDRARAAGFLGSGLRLRLGEV